MSSLKTEYIKFTLSNGIKCILYPRTEIHSVSISAKINVGSLDETKETNGISHLLEHLAFDATKDYDSWEKLNTYMNSFSGSSNAYTSDDHTKYYATLPYQYLEDGIKYISQVSLYQLFNESDVKKEVDIILDEKVRYDDSIEYQVQMEVLKNRFEDNDTCFSRDLIGTVENLKSFTKQTVEDHFNKHYVPENIEVYLVGNFDIAKATNLLEKYFGTFKSKAKPNRLFINTYPNYSNFTIKAKQKLDINQYYLIISFPSLEFLLTTFEERSLLAFLSVITASQQHQTSILWRRLREELGLVYDVSAWTYSMMSRSMFAIDTNFNPENLKVVLSEIYSGVNKIKMGLEGKEIFERRKKRLIDTELMRYDNPATVIDWISSQEEELEYHGKSIAISDYIKLIQSFKFEDVINLANKIYNWDKANIIVMSKDDPTNVEANIIDIWNNLTND